MAFKGTGIDEKGVGYVFLVHSDGDCVNEDFLGPGGDKGGRPRGKPQEGE